MTSPPDHVAPAKLLAGQMLTGAPPLRGSLRSATVGLSWTNPSQRPSGEKNAAAPPGTSSTRFDSRSLNERVYKFGVEAAPVLKAIRLPSGEIATRSLKLDGKNSPSGVAIVNRVRVRETAP